VHAVSRGLDKIDLFVTDDSGEIWTGAWDPVSLWQGWRLRDRFEPGSFFPNVEPGAPVTVVSRRVDHLDIFVVGKDDKAVYTAAWEPGFAFWHGWCRLPLMQGDVHAPVHAVSRDTDRLDVFVTDEHGKMYTASWAPQSLWQASTVAARSAFVPPIAGGAPIVPIKRSTDHMDLFVVATDGRVWTAAWEPAFGGPWRGWRPVGY
jgi:hypothetical protein